MRTILQLSVVLAFVSQAFAADREDARYSADAESTAKRKRQAILAEIKGIEGNEWAGEYYAGDGLGVNTSVVIAPKSGYVFEWHGCLGLYDRNYGDVTWTNGRVRLSFTFENEREGLQELPTELIPISWGPRRYLIPADDVVGFCNDVNAGGEPRNGSHGLYLLRRGDEKVAVTGFPTVPKQYQEYLLAKPIEATIIAVGPYTTRPSVVDWKFKDTPVTIDAGARQGVRVGMELVVTNPEDAIDSVRVTKVDETRAEAVMIQAGEEEPGPKVGWRLSTQAPWNVPRAK
jgi:hypothetical protein